MSVVRLNKEQEVIAFFVRRAKVAPGRTMLMKLLYLTDYEARRYLGRPITAANYVLYKHGPFCDDLYQHLDALKQADVAIEERVQFPNGKMGSRFSAGPAVAQPSFTPAEIEILSYVARKYAGMELSDLLEEVVYKTEPMLDALARGSREERLELGMAMVDNAMGRDLGMPFEELLDRKRRVRSGEVIGHAEAMRRLDELLTEAAA